MNKSTLRRAYDGLIKLPAAVRNRALQALFCTNVKYAGTSGIEFLELSPQRTVMRVRNRKKVRNHIGGLHALAMALVGESATGVLVALNLPAGRTPVIKHMGIDYTKRCQGDLIATATLRPEQIQAMQNDAKGEVTVPVSFSDQKQQSPIEARMVWAWITPRAQ